MRISHYLYSFALALMISCNAKPKNNQQANALPKVNIDSLRSSMLPKTAIIANQLSRSPTINPPHGQPGHDCSVAVGAPLNTANHAGGNTTASTSAPAVSKTVVSPPKIVANAAPTVAKGMNPPHGQPNHRCDIPVGAPLNSKPSTATTTQTPAAAQTVIEPPKFNEKGELLNPSHGQPNHRCDIAVGQPLNSKPTQEASKPPTQAEPAKQNNGNG